MTLWNKYKEQWKNCRRCFLHKTRTKVVLARGMIPAPILFIGEAPGKSEDVRGKPFIGPAGKVLDRIISEGIDGQFDYALTNVIACIPREDDGTKSKEPPEVAVKACKKRLLGFLALCKPRMVICVGALAAKKVPPLLDDSVSHVRIIHPAAILRADDSSQELSIRRCIAVVSGAISEL